MQKFAMVCLILMGVLFLASTPAQQRDEDRPRPTRWRHLALTDTGLADGELSRRINQLGDDGWELVDVEGFPTESQTIKTVYYFKKPDGV